MERKVALEVKDISKNFEGLKALNNMDFKLYEGEIIAIVGENGAGKSTLIKIISGAIKRSSGKIYVNGEEVDINNRNDAKNFGIETVFQDQTLIQNFDASLNLFLGREKFRKRPFGKFFKLIDYRYMKDETIKLFKKIGVGVKDIGKEVRFFSGGQRQGVVVGRAVYWGGKILIFDEPTNNLGVNEQKTVLDLIVKLREEHNMSILIISHNLYNVFQIVDRIIVLRNGEKVGERNTKDTNQNEIVSMITGLSF
ncbi:MAG: ATP-binding cassette domain-containing protein [Candidatus Humimicrobiaceae bacterium]